MKTEVKNNKKSQAKNTTKKTVSKKALNSKKKQPAKKNKNVKLRRYIVITVGLTIILSTIIILILISDIFNIKQITVENNSKVSTQKILQTSGLAIDYNMFRTPTRIIKKKIKTDPYIESVRITKKLNGEVIINVQERVATYMLQNENQYVYINNQGYILEISQNPLELPIIKGFSTKEIQTGGRINVEDLKKLDIVIQIMDTAESNGIREKITTIDISDANNYILEIPSENKTVQFGDASNINVKILWIIDLIDKEKGISGDIVLNVPNIKKVYFREKV